MAQNPYIVDPGNDYSSGLSGLSSALGGIRQDRIAQGELQRRQQEQQLKQDQYDRANQRFTEVQAAAQKAFASQDPDVIAQTAVQYPEITPMLQAATGLKDDTQNREALDFTRAFATADDSARPALYENRIKSILKRGGDPTHTIQSYQDYQQNPQAETRDVLSYWAGIDPKGYGAYSNEQKQQQKQQMQQAQFDQANQQFQQAEAGRNQRAATRNALTGAGGQIKPTAHIQDFKQYQDLKNTDPEAAKAFGQAAGFVSKEGRELAPGVQQRLAKTIDSAVAAENNIGKFNNLADEIDKSDLGGGYLKGSFSEKLKDITGNQDAITDLRREVNSVKATQATANLPPGSASDADVRLAMGPFPTDNANKTQLASWLRGLAKIQKVNADFHNFKADYISDNGTERGMLQAWKAQGGTGQGAGAATPAIQPTKPAASGGWEIIQ